MAPACTLSGSKLLAKFKRRLATVRVAAAVPLLPALEVRSPLVLSKLPATVPTTSTATEQDDMAPTDPPLKVTVEPPDGADSAEATPQVVLALGGEARTTPAGRLSTKARSPTGAPDLLEMVKLSRLALPTPMVSGEKAFEKLGWATAGRATARVERVSRTLRGIDLRNRIRALQGGGIP